MLPTAKYYVDNCRIIKHGMSSLTGMRKYQQVFCFVLLGIQLCNNKVLLNNIPRMSDNLN